MRAYDLIAKTKRGIPLSGEEIRWLIGGYVAQEIPDYQMAAWLMAVCFRGLTDEETTALTLTMRDSVAVLDLSGIHGVTVDKHSTGGVGDKTSLILAPIVAACGVAVPKMSGRGLGHTGGTIDKLESIPGFSTQIPFERFVETVNRAGFSIVAQSGGLVPADKKLYALRDLTATVDSIPLICASIMSKKLATGADGILLDVKLGSGAFMKTEADAKALAEAMVRTASLAGKRCRAVITDMDAPLGMTVGNAIEVTEAIDVLHGNVHNALGELCLDLACEMLSLSGKGNTEACRRLAEDAVSSGAALERLRTMIACQGGNPAVVDEPTLLPQPKYAQTVCAQTDGYLSHIDSESIGVAAMELGAGRRKKEDTLDLSAGIRLHHTVGDFVKAGEPLLTLYSSGVTDFSAVSNRVLGAVLQTEQAPEHRGMIRAVVRNKNL